MHLNAPAFSQIPEVADLQYSMEYGPIERMYLRIHEGSSSTMGCILCLRALFWNQIYFDGEEKNGRSRDPQAEPDMSNGPFSGAPSPLPPRQTAEQRAA